MYSQAGVQVEVEGEVRKTQEEVRAQHQAHGAGDFVETVRHALNFGWDADNNAAASGAILGVIKGNKFLQSQGWKIKDQYRDTSRDEVPSDETITSYGDRLIAMAEANIVRQGGSKATVTIPKLLKFQKRNIQSLTMPSHLFFTASLI